MKRVLATIAVLVVVMLFGGYDSIRRYMQRPLEGEGLPWSGAGDPGGAVAPEVLRPIGEGARLSPTRIIYFRSDIVGAPLDLLVAGQRLVLVGRGHHRLVVFDRVTGQMMASGFPAPRAPRRGSRAPDETEFNRLAPDRIQPNYVWVHELARRRLTCIDLSPAANGKINEDRIRERLVLGGSGMLRTPVFTPSGIVSAGYLNRGLLERFDRRSGKPLDVIGVPPVTDINTDVDFRHHMNFGELAGTVDGTRLAIAFQAQPRIDLLSGTGARIAAVVWRDGDPGRPPEVAKDGEGKKHFTFRAGFRAGFLDVSVTDRHVFALYGGNRVDDGVRFELGSQVLVLDWAGRLVQVLRLTRPATTIAVADDERTLYATARTDEMIAEYVINEWTSRP